MGFALGDCRLGQRPLQRGGQVARLTTMAIYAQVYPGTADLTSAACEGVPCRNPNRVNVFAAGDPAGCPDKNDPLWLLDTPSVGTGLRDHLFLTKLSEPLLSSLKFALAGTFDNLDQVALEVAPATARESSRKLTDL